MDSIRSLTAARRFTLPRVQCTQAQCHVLARCRERSGRGAARYETQSHPRLHRGPIAAMSCVDLPGRSMAIDPPRRPGRPLSHRFAPLHRALLAWVFIQITVAGCASTTTWQLAPSPQSPVCQREITALILWTTQWRPDQKDVAHREAAAAEGLGRFFADSGCFGSVAVQRLPERPVGLVEDAAAKARARGEKVVLVSVRELGPTVRIGTSLALVEGATEVVLDLTAFEPALPMPRTFSVHWRSGGPGTLKGVATLPQDMQAALAAGLQPAAR